MFEMSSNPAAFIKALIDAMKGPPEGPLVKVQAEPAALKIGDACAPASKAQYQQLVDLANELGVVAPMTYTDTDFETFPHLHSYHGYVIGGNIPAAVKVNWIPVAEFDARMRESGRLLEKSGGANDPIHKSKKRWTESTSWSTPPRPIHGSPAHKEELDRGSKPQKKSEHERGFKISDFKISDGDTTKPKPKPDILEKLLGISPRETLPLVSDRFKPVEGWSRSPAGLPPIATGDRVERGPEWDIAWGNQDGGVGKQGTVLGPDPNDDPKWIAVRWDNGNVNVYPYTSGLVGVTKCDMHVQLKKATTQPTQTKTMAPPKKPSTFDETRASILKQQEKVRGAIQPNSVAIDTGSTSRIIIPEGMTKSDAADELYRQHEEDMKVANYSRMFDGYYYEDVLIATRGAIERTFGWLDSRTIPGGFFSPSQPPRMIDVVTDMLEGDVPVLSKAFIGRAGVAAWDEDAYVETKLNGPFNAGIMARARKMHEGQINAFFDLIGDILRTESIFRGKAVTVEYQEGEPELGVPEGIHMSMFYPRTNPNIVLNERTQGILDVLVQSDLHEDNKRIYLFTGDYGNGKTETAIEVGAAARELGYAYMYVKSPDHLADILLASKKYLPALVFMEDIDQVASGEDRSEEINEVLNTLDGTELKGQNIKVIVTTNHPDRLNQALRRPGRIDIVVKFENPDKASKREIITRILRNEKGFDSLDLDACVEMLPDAQGAFIAEICKRAKQYGASKKKGEKASKGLSDKLFKAACDSTVDHIEMMNTQVEVKSDLAEAVGRLGEALDRH